MKAVSTVAEGARFEAMALAQLQAAGLRLVARNVRGIGGEIDLIMLDGDTLAFIEVRRRRSAAFGGAAASVEARKQQRILRTAQYWLQRHPQHARRSLRFDIVAFDGPQAQAQWLRGAFAAA